MKKDMEKHVRIVSKIMLALGIFYLVLLGLFCLLGLWATKNYLQAGEDVALVPAFLTGLTFLIPLGLFAVFHIITGRAFPAGAPWARIALWILAALNLGNVPLGTAFGAYAIWILVNTRDDVKLIKQEDHKVT